MATRLDLDGNPIKPMTICMIGAGGFIGSHLCEKLMAETPHIVLAVDVYNDKIKHLLDAPPPEQHGGRHPWDGRIQFHRLNIKNDSRLEGLIKMSDLTINLAAICTPADYNTRPLDTIYSNFIDALPVVKYCSENGKRLIHFSTCEVYGKTIGSFLPKDNPLRQVCHFISGYCTLHGQLLDEKKRTIDLRKDLETKDRLMGSLKEGKEKLLKLREDDRVLIEDLRAQVEAAGPKAVEAYKASAECHDEKMAFAQPVFDEALADTCQRIAARFP